MDEMNELFPYPSTDYPWPRPGFHKPCSNAKVHVADKRMARLLLVLHELDRTVAGLENLRQPDLNELVSSAILACGFVNGTEARFAIAAVLDAIEKPGWLPGSD
jgi:hypothetical protein